MANKPIPYVIFLALFMLLSPAALSQKRIVSSQYTFFDDFETIQNEFWGEGVYSVRSQACPWSEVHGKSLVITYPPATEDNPHSWAEQRFSMPFDARQIEIEYDLFVPGNYYRAARNHKNIVFWSGAYGKVNANISVSSESWPVDRGTTPSIYIGSDGVNYGHSMISDKSELYMENYAGAWQHMNVYLELAVNDQDYGVFEIYRDGHVVTATGHPKIEPNYNNPPTSEQIRFAHRGNYISEGYLMGWANGGFKEKTIFCIDNFSVKVRSDVGNYLDKSPVIAPRVSVRKK